MNAAESYRPDIGMYAFWDIDKSKLDFAKDKDFIISRMFDRGKFDDVLKTVSFYGLVDSKKSLLSNKYLSRQGMYLANALLNIPIEQFASYAAPQHD